MGGLPTDREKQTIGFAIDINGILTEKKNPVPGAMEVIHLLQRNRIPFVILTNWGGHTEEYCAEELNRALGLGYKTPDHIRSDQFIHSHTVLHDIAPKHTGKNVLALSERPNWYCKAFLGSYGFKNIFIEQNFADLVRRGKAPEIAAILVIQTQQVPNSNFALESITRLLSCKNGKWDTPSKLNGKIDLPSKGYSQEGALDLYIADGYRFIPRLEIEWKARTSAELTTLQLLSKPFSLQFEVGESALHDNLSLLRRSRTKIDMTYMIGDTLCMDIKGVNKFTP